MGITHLEHELKKPLGMMISTVGKIVDRKNRELTDFLLQAGWDSTDGCFDPQLNKQIGNLKKKLKDTESIEIVIGCGKGYSLKTR